MVVDMASGIASSVDLDLLSALSEQQLLLAVVGLLAWLREEGGPLWQLWMDDRIGANAQQASWVDWLASIEGDGPVEQQLAPFIALVNAQKRYDATHMVV